MKFWIGGALVGMLAFSIGGCGGSGSSGSPSPTADVARLSATATPFATAHPARSPIGAGDDTSTLVPTPTAPLSCGFGSGIWEECAKTAIDPAFADYVTRFSIPTGEEQAVVIEERIEWPDSCLGVETPDVLCLQVITPGFRFVVTGGPGTTYAEYHTDLAGHIVFFNSYPTYLDVPPTHTPAP